MIRKEENWIYIIITISSIAILTALIAEHLFKILPCKMCLHQRYPYYFIIVLIIIQFFINKFSNIWYLLPIEGALFYGLFYATWHVGIEQTIFPGLSTCTASLDNANSLTDLKNQIFNQVIITCDEISWTILGLSAATLNLLIVLFLLIFNTIFLIQDYYDKKQNN